MRLRDAPQPISNAAVVGGVADQELAAIAVVVGGIEKASRARDVEETVVGLVFLAARLVDHAALAGGGGEDVVVDLIPEFLGKGVEAAAEGLGRECEVGHGDV